MTWKPEHHLASDPTQHFEPSPSNKWDERFLRLAFQIATWSKDPSTKTGALIVRPDRTVASLGYNGFPRGMKDDMINDMPREERYSRIVHCEMNALLMSRDPIPLTGYTLYTTGPSCDRCVVHMIQAGIRRFVFPKVDPDRWQRWNVGRTLNYLMEAKCEIVMYPENFH